MPVSYAGSETQFVSGGAILPVSDYLDYMPNFADKIEKWGLQEDLDNLRQDDGKFYLLPGLREKPDVQYSVMINDDMWKKAGDHRGPGDLGGVRRGPREGQGGEPGAQVRVLRPLEREPEPPPGLPAERHGAQLRHRGWLGGLQQRALRRGHREVRADRHHGRVQAAPGDGERLGRGRHDGPGDHAERRPGQAEVRHRQVRRRLRQHAGAHRVPHGDRGRRQGLRHPDAHDPPAAPPAATCPPAGSPPAS